MKKLFQNTGLIFILLLSLCANAQTFSSVPIWAEEFNGNSILPNSTLWNNEIGMIRNAELQYYTDRDIDNQILVNDELQIIGRRENFGGARYTSASLTSKSSWKYGKIEGRIKMETGMGIWGCFWTLGKNISWPSCGEIDLIEHINSEAQYHATAHWWNETLSTADKHDGDGSSCPNPVGTYNANNYNTYSIEWTPSYIKWYLNNNLVKTMSILNGIRGTWEFHAPQYVLLNCPIGGSWPQIDAGASWNEALIPVPNTMYVDYVRVYSYDSGAPAPPITITSSAVTQSSFTVNWTASSGATAYDVVLDKNGTITTYGPFSTTSCTITGLTANTNYAVRVKARNLSTNSSDLSELSNPLYVTTVSGTPPTPLINLQFSENSGSSTSNSGEVGGSLDFKGTAAWSTNTPANSSNRTSAISIANNADAVETPYLVDQFKGLNDITITGWLNCKDATETNGNRIVNCLGSQWFDPNRGTGGFDLAFKTDGSLQLGINEAVGATSARSSAGKITTDAAAGAANWKFFAVTYSASAQSVSFYFGTTAASATLDKTVPYNRGVIGTDIDPLAIGNLNTITRGWLTGRMFRGLIDQIQIYSSLLTLPQIVSVQNNITGILLTSVGISPSTLTLNSIGASTTLTTTLLPSNATYQTLTWLSSNTSVATVSNAGVVTALKNGTASISATSIDGSNLTATVAITVAAPVLGAVYEAETSVVFNNGTIDAAVIPANAVPAIIASPNASGGSVVGNFANSNSFIRYNIIDGGPGGAANLTIRYSNGTGVNQSLTYHYYSADKNSNFAINQIIFPPTANWDTFAEVTVSVILTSGSNQSLKLQKISPTSYPNDFTGVGPRIDNLTISFVNWTGAFSTAYENPLNWLNNVMPPVNSIINIPAGLVNYPVINTDQTIAAGIIASGASLTIASGKSLRVTGSLVSNCIATATEFTSRRITNNGTLTNNGIITNNGELILQSDAAGTANLWSASAVNNVSQQRYLSSNQRGWRLLSNPLSSTTFSALAAASNITLRANYTGAYDSVTNTWSSTDGTAPINTNSAYKVFITGKAGESPTYVSGPTNVTLVNKGTAGNTAPSDVTTIAGRLYLVANPYTAPVSAWSIRQASSGLSSTVSYYNPTKSSTNVRLMAGGYDAKVIDNLSITAAGRAGDVLIPPMGALFFYATTAGTIKVPSTSIFTGFPLVDPLNASLPATLYNHKIAQKKAARSVALTIDVESTGVDYDQLQLRFKEVGTEGSNVDFGKLSNTFLNFYSIYDSKNMAVSELELKDQIIPLGITSTIQKSYTFKVVENTIPAGFEAFLVDNYLNINTVLTAGTDYAFTIDSNPASQGNARFAINLQKAGELSIEDAAFDSQIQVWPNPAHSQVNILNAQSQNEGISTITISNLEGKVIYSQKAKAGSTTTIQTNSWAAGVYLLKASKKGAKTIKKLIIQ